MSPVGKMQVAVSRERILEVLRPNIVRMLAPASDEWLAIKGKANAFWRREYYRRAAVRWRTAWLLRDSLCLLPWDSAAAAGADRPDSRSHTLIHRPVPREQEANSL